MPGCAAVNCRNSSEKGGKFFRFPAAGNRRAIWVQNMRRGNNWTPTEAARLCSEHFEASQFESGRADGWKKLKPNAIPTLFNVPNPPPLINPPPRKSLYKSVNRSAVPVDSTTARVEISDQQITATDRYNDVLRDVSEHNTVESTDETETTRTVAEHVALLRQELQQQQQRNIENENAIKLLRMENQKLEQQVTNLNTTQRSCLNEDQIRLLEQGRVAHWPNESIMKGLKFRFALSIHGYEFLRSSGYPLPAYSTIMRRIQDFKVNFGVFVDVLKLLPCKVETMDSTDRFCILSYDEMQIKKQRDFDKNDKIFYGPATLGGPSKDPANPESLGEKMYVVVARGLKNSWKQVIASHVTMKESIDPQVLRAFMLQPKKKLPVIDKLASTGPILFADNRQI